MNTKIKSENHSEDEIDLFELIFKVFKFIKRYSIYYGIAIVLGFLIGFILPKLTETTYTSESIAIVETVDKEVAESIIKHFSDFLSSDEEFLNKEKYSILNDIISVTTKIDMSEKSKEYIKITVQTKKYIDREQLKKSLTNFFQNNSYIKEQAKIFKKQSPLIIARINEEISKIELEQNNNINAKKGQQILIEGSKNNGEILIDLFTQKLLIEKQLETFEPIVFLTDFGPFLPSTSKSLTYGLISSAFLFLLTFIISIIININKSLLVQNKKEENLTI